MLAALVPVIIDDAELLCGRQDPVKNVITTGVLLASKMRSLLNKHRDVQVFCATNSPWYYFVKL